MNVDSILQLVKDAGVTGLLALAILGGFRKWWVFGWQYRACDEERLEWKRLALGGTNLTEQAVQVAKTATQEAEKS